MAEAAAVRAEKATAKVTPKPNPNNKFDENTSQETDMPESDSTKDDGERSQGDGSIATNSGNMVIRNIGNAIAVAVRESNDNEKTMSIEGTGKIFEDESIKFKSQPNAEEVKQERPRLAYNHRKFIWRRKTEEDRLVDGQNEPGRPVNSEK